MRRSAEVDMLATDLDRANQRVLTAERQLESYKRVVESNQNRLPDDRVITVTVIKVTSHVCFQNTHLLKLSLMLKLL